MAGLLCETSDGWLGAVGKVAATMRVAPDGSDPPTAL